MTRPNEMLRPEITELCLGNSVQKTETADGHSGTFQRAVEMEKHHARSGNGDMSSEDRNVGAKLDHVCQVRAGQIILYFFLQLNTF